MLLTRLWLYCTSSENRNAKADSDTCAVRRVSQAQARRNAPCVACLRLAAAERALHDAGQRHALHGRAALERARPRCATSERGRCAPPRESAKVDALPRPRWLPTLRRGARAARATRRRLRPRPTTAGALVCAQSWPCAHADAAWAAFAATRRRPAATRTRTTRRWLRPRVAAARRAPVAAQCLCRRLSPFRRARSLRPRPARRAARRPPPRPQPAPTTTTTHSSVRPSLLPLFKALLSLRQALLTTPPLAQASSSRPAPTSPPPPRSGWSATRPTPPARSLSSTRSSSRRETHALAHCARNQRCPAHPSHRAGSLRLSRAALAPDARAAFGIRRAAGFLAALRGRGVGLGGGSDAPPCPAQCCGASVKLTGARLVATPDMDALLLSLAQEALANGVRPS